MNAAMKMTERIAFSAASSVQTLTLVLGGLLCGAVSAQEHSQHSANEKRTEPPKVYLDKSPKVVEYQLKRLSNSQLLSIETALDHPKYVPVFAAIALRPGMSVEQRGKGIEGLAKLSKKSTSETVLEQLAKLKSEDREQQRVAKELTEMLLRGAVDASNATVIDKGAKEKSPLVLRAAMAALVQTGRAQVAEELANSNEQARVGLLEAISFVSSNSKREGLREFVLASLKAAMPVAVRRAAVANLPNVGGAAVGNFAELAKLIVEPEIQDVVVQSLLKLDVAQIQAVDARPVIDHLVARAEAAPAAERTADRFVDAAQLVDRLLAKLPEAESRALRERMQEIVVRVVRIKTVAEEMRYDIKYFVAAAGKPMQIILQNEDLMPHNLVIVEPGTLKEVAIQAGTMPPDALTDGKQYVPAVPQVLFATKMIQAGKQERLTFTAPKTPGEYPFVCTYPNHWLRMYGVMVVVDDVDAYMQNPKEPKDPIGNNRSFVKNWELDDFEDTLEAGLRGRSAEIGSKIFAEATCLQCHAIRNQGGRVGPDLTEVFKRHEGNAMAVLREIIEPSQKIDPKYALHSVLTLDGQVFSGVIVAEDEKSISLLSSPDQPKPNVIQRSEIDDMVQSPKSIMPAALMDQFTEDEIYELLAYIQDQVGK